ncbi:MAG: PBP1A family penicillin-binding protein [Desulfohalobiaceae bacterium]|nr:PBP1A family penicillin-binding protein [Desulfohalobiaceae bacterium]
MLRFLKYFLIIFVCLVVLAVGAGAGVYYWAASGLPTIEKIADYSPSLTTTIYSHRNETLGYLSRENRFLRSQEQMTEDVRRAFMAAEDSGFYEHGAIDLMGILRAAIKNLRAGQIVQGGSTITQQVVKSLLLTPKRSYKRKLKEAILAYRLEKHLSKDEILTIYLNQIYLGEGAYGVEAAARVYFGKHADEITLAESALLAGLPKAPSQYNPYDNPEQARQRRKYVLRQMRNMNWISDWRFEKTKDAPLDLSERQDPTWRLAPDYVEQVRRWLLKEFGEKKVYQGGLKVYTAADLEHQKAAEEAVRSGLEASTKRRGWRGPLKHLSATSAEAFLEGQNASEQVKALRQGEWIKVLVNEVSKKGAKVRFANETAWMDVSSMAWCREINPEKAPENVPEVKNARKVLDEGDVVWASLAETSRKEQGRWRLLLQQRPKVQGALFSMDPESGKVRALIGGYDYDESEFNRAIQAMRQPGSAFKPIVYSAAFDEGMTPATQVLDAPIVYQDTATNSTWKPQNYERMNFGPTLLRTALVKSRNLVTIRVAREIGIDRVIQRARTLGLKGDFPRDLSVSLGSGSVSLRGMCRAYSAFARRDGSRVEPRFVLKVTGPRGEVLYESNKTVQEAISPQTSYIMAELMQQVVQYGTGWRVKRAIDRPVAGKTGTTDEQKDAWYMGYSPNLLAGVFVGFDDPRPMGKYETGSRAAAPIWIDYWKRVQSGYPVLDFQKPQGIVMARVDAENGLLAGPGTEESYMIPFKAGTQPQKVSPAKSEGSNTGSDGGDGSSHQDDRLKEIF